MRSVSEEFQRIIPFVNCQAVDLALLDTMVASEGQSSDDDHDDDNNDDDNNDDDDDGDDDADDDDYDNEDDGDDVCIFVLLHKATPVDKPQLQKQLNSNSAPIKDL